MRSRVYRNEELRVRIWFKYANAIIIGRVASSQSISPSVARPPELKFHWKPRLGAECNFTENISELRANGPMRWMAA